MPKNVYQYREEGFEKKYPTRRITGSVARLPGAVDYRFGLESVSSERLQRSTNSTTEHTHFVLIVNDKIVPTAPPLLALFLG